MFGSVYSWISRSFWTVRSGSERNGHWAPVEARILGLVVGVGRDRGDLGVGDGVDLPGFDGESLVVE